MRKQAAIFENLVASERDYTQLLATLCTSYLTALIACSNEINVSDDDLDLLFTGIPNLYTVHQELCCKLRSCSPQMFWVPFVESKEMFKVYEELIGKAEKVVAILTKLSTNGAFAAQLSEILHSPKCGDVLSLPCLLYLPFQRIRRYRNILLVSLT